MSCRVRLFSYRWRNTGAVRVQHLRGRWRPACSRRASSGASSWMCHSDIYAEVEWETVWLEGRLEPKEPFSHHSQVTSYPELLNCEVISSVNNCPNERGDVQIKLQLLLQSLETKVSFISNKKLWLKSKHFNLCINLFYSQVDLRCHSWFLSLKSETEKRKTKPSRRKKGRQKEIWEWKK